MALSIFVFYVAAFTILDLVFAKPLNWTESIGGGLVFTIIMTGIQVYKERKNK